MSLCLAIKTNEREEKGILEVKADVERDKVRLTLQVPIGRYLCPLGWEHSQSWL